MDDKYSIQMDEDERARIEIEYLNKVKKELNNSKGKNVKWLLKAKKNEHINRLYDLDWNWLNKFKREINIDHIPLKYDGIEGAVELIQSQTKHKRGNILNNPAKALKVIEYIRIKNVLQNFFEENPDFNFNNIIDDNLIKSFKSYAEKRENELDEIIKAFDDDLPF